MTSLRRAGEDRDAVEAHVAGWFDEVTFGWKAERELDALARAGAEIGFDHGSRVHGDYVVPLAEV